MTVQDIRGYMNLVEGKEEKLTLSPLPFEMGDLSPVLSKDNIDYHYNVLSKGYVDREVCKQLAKAFISAKVNIKNFKNDVLINNAELVQKELANFPSYFTHVKT